MFKNPNYEQYKDYVAPYNEHFICGFVAYIYWVVLYLKLFWLGTDEDRVELAKCYDNAVKDEVTVDDGSFYHRDMSHYYRTACADFIRQVTREAYEDDQKRETMVKLAACKKTREEFYEQSDLLTSEREARMLARQEAQWDDENVGNDERNHYNMVEIDGKMQHRVAKIPLLTKMGIPIIKEEEIPCGDGHFVHIRIYDKIWNFYCVAVWSDKRPLNKDGSINYQYVFTETYAPNPNVKGFGKGKGAVKYGREIAAREKIRHLMNNWKELEYSDSVTAITRKIL
jgi:hypothetical protein